MELQRKAEAHSCSNTEDVLHAALHHSVTRGFTMHYRGTTSLRQSLEGQGRCSLSHGLMQYRAQGRDSKGWLLMGGFSHSRFPGSG